MLAPPPASAKRLLDFIRGYEAPKGYDTVFRNQMARMPKPITSMTIDEVIADGPRRTREFGSSAAGGEQFMTATLKALKATLGLSGSELMTPANQDALGYQLLKQRGYAAFVAGQTSVTAFGLQLAQEWASFPVLVDTPVYEGKGEHRKLLRTPRRGQSYYAGDGLNKALVKPEAVEQMLNSLRSAPALATAAAQEEPLISAPRAQTVTPPAIRGQSWFSRLLGRKPPVDRPGLNPNGRPELWDIQKILKDKGYYLTGRLDGLDGGRTQGAIAQSRKDNGLGDGGIDAAFMELLPRLPQRPVSVETANLPVTQAIAAKPELFNPLGWLGGTGVASLATAAASGSGLLDQVQTATGKINDVAGSVQTGIGYATSITGFLVEHKTIVFVAIGVFLIGKVFLMGCDIVARIRAALA